MALSRRAADLILLVVMKVTLTSNFYTFRYLRIADFVYNATTQACERKPDSELRSVDRGVIITYGIEFLLPVLGGLLCDKYLRELLCLRWCAGLLLMTSFYLTVINYLQLLCNVPLYYFGTFLLSLTNGLGMAILVTAVFKTAAGHLFNSTATCMIYYCSAALGELLGTIPDAIRSLNPQLDYTFVSSIFALIFGGCTLLLRLEWLDDEGTRRRGVWRISWYRTMQLVTLNGPFIILVWCFGTLRAATSCVELRSFLGAVNETRPPECNIVTIGYDSGTMIVSVVIAVVCGKQLLSFGVRSIRKRLNAGLVIQLLSRLSIIALLLSGLDRQLNSTAYVIIYLVSSAIDGCSNAFGLAAGYELMFLYAPDWAKNLGMGILFTIWSTSTVMTGVLMLLLMHVPYDDPIIPPSGYTKNFHNLYVPHLILAIGVTLVLLYTNFFYKTRLRQVVAQVEGQQVGADPDSQNNQLINEGEAEEGGHSNGENIPNSVTDEERPLLL